MSQTVRHRHTSALALQAVVADRAGGRYRQNWPDTAFMDKSTLIGAG